MVYRLVTHFLQPFVLLHLVMGLAIACLWWKSQSDRRRLVALTLAYGAFTFICLPVTGYLAIGSLEWSYPPLDRRPAQVDAIVVLSGGVIPADSVRPKTTPSAPTFYRCEHAADLYHQSDPCRVFVLGGKLDRQLSGPADAQVMADLLVQLGVDRSDIVGGGTSQNTFQNAVEFRQLRESFPCDRIILVTDATHLQRSIACFRKLGIEVIPAGCQYRATDLRLSTYSFLPDLAGAAACETAAHEWIGLAWYWFRGRI